jgi:hypothetical protein
VRTGIRVEVSVEVVVKIASEAKKEEEFLSLYI